MTSRQLPLLPRHGSRSRMTCAFRCGNACDHPEPNQTGHDHIRDVLARQIARRSVLKGTAAAGTGMALSAGAGTGTSATAAPTSPRPAGPTGGAAVSALAFEPVAPNTRDAVTVAEGFRHQVVVGWGDPVEPGAPAFDVQHQSPRRRPSSSATTATTWPCCRCPAAGRCWW